MTNKIYNSLIVSFLTFGAYNLPGCDPNNKGESATEGSTSQGQESICGDCQVNGNEECDVCSYSGVPEFSFCTDKKWPVGGEFGPCTVAWNNIPQLDCHTANWVDTLDCDQKEADLVCKIYTKNEKAKAIAGSWEIGGPSDGIQRSLLVQNEIEGKGGVKITQLPKLDYQGEVWSYDNYPFNTQLSIPIMTVKECFIEQ